jgi:hypothetical protein
MEWRAAAAALKPAGTMESFKENFKVFLVNIKQQQKKKNHTKSQQSSTFL